MFYARIWMFRNEAITMIIQHYNGYLYISARRLFLSLSLLLFWALIMGRVATTAENFEATYKAYKGHVQSGSELLQKGDYQQAVVNFSRAIEMSPFEAMLYFNRGIALYKSGKMKEAEEDFEKALILDQRMVNALLYRGLCREKLGKEKAALEDYTRAMQQQPDDVSIQNNLAWLYATAKEEGGTS
jgi:Tfp pilus assembly protein PilF